MILIVIILLFLGLSIRFPKSTVLSLMMATFVYCLLGHSYDEVDSDTYEHIYDIAKAFGSADYEVLYELLMKFCYTINLSFDGFRRVAACLTVISLYYCIRKYSNNQNFVWLLYIIYFAMFDEVLIRSRLAMPYAIMYGFVLVNAQKKIDYLYSLLWLTLAALFHSSCWALFLFAPLTFLYRKYNIGYQKLLLIIFTIYIGVIFLGNSIFDLYSIFTIREGTIEKYMTDSYSNLNGIIYNILKYLLYLTPVLLYYKSEYASDEYYIESNSRMNFSSFLFLNLLFASVLIPQYFVYNYYRLFRYLILINYIFLSNRLIVGEKISPKALMIGVAYAICNLCIFIFYEQPDKIETVLLMHVQTNDLLKLFNF